MNNYLEKLRFTLLLDNINDKRVNPKIFLGIDEDIIDYYVMNNGENKIIFDAVIYETGAHSVWFKIDDNNKNFANDINSIIVKDLKIHGISIASDIFQCIYYPSYDSDYLKENPSLPSQLKSVLHVGNNGSWHWLFKSPIYENRQLAIGLW